MSVKALEVFPMFHSLMFHLRDPQLWWTENPHDFYPYTGKVSCHEITAISYLVFFTQFFWFCQTKIVQIQCVAYITDKLLILTNSFKGNISNLKTLPVQMDTRELYSSGIWHFGLSVRENIYSGKTYFRFNFEVSVSCTSPVKFSIHFF